MKAKTYILLFCIIFGLRLAAQDPTATIDRVYTKTGHIYEGHITDDRKGDHLTIVNKANVSNLIMYYDILKIQYETAAIEYSDSSMYKKRDENELITFNGYSASSHVTDKLIRKRNTGIVLTAIGLGLLVGGIALVATTPSQTLSNGYGGTSEVPGLGLFAGVAMIVGSVGVTIPGVLIWGRANAKIRQAQMQAL